MTKSRSASCCSKLVVPLTWLQYILTYIQVFERTGGRLASFQKCVHRVAQLHLQKVMADETQEWNVSYKIMLQQAGSGPFTAVRSALNAQNTCGLQCCVCFIRKPRSSKTQVHLGLSEDIRSSGRFSLSRKIASLSPRLDRIFLCGVLLLSDWISLDAFPKTWSQ